MSDSCIAITVIKGTWVYCSNWHSWYSFSLEQERKNRPKISTALEMENSSEVEFLSVPELLHEPCISEILYSRKKASLCLHGSWV